MALNCKVFSPYTGVPNSGSFNKAYLEKVNFFNELLKVKDKSSAAEEKV
jgi:hypothetical protein